MSEDDNTETPPAADRMANARAAKAIKALQEAGAAALPQTPAAPLAPTGDIAALKAEVAELRALLGEAALRKVVPVSIASSVLKNKTVQEPLVEMTLMDKGRGKVSTGGLSGFERIQEFGACFTTPESSGRQLWNKDYATPVDRGIIAKWEKENERERIGLMAEKNQLKALLDKVHYHDKVRAPDTLDHIPVV